MQQFVCLQKLAILVKCQESDVKQIKEWTGSLAANWMNAEGLILDRQAPKQAKACWWRNTNTSVCFSCVRRVVQATDAQMQQKGNKGSLAAARSECSGFLFVSLFVLCVCVRKFFVVVLLFCMCCFVIFCFKLQYKVSPNYQMIIEHIKYMQFVSSEYFTILALGFRVLSF